MKGNNPFSPQAWEGRLSGRKAERGRLRAWASGAASGTPEGMVVSGAAGMGKSSLLKWLRKDAEGKGLLAIYAGAGRGERLPAFLEKLSMEAEAALAERAATSARHAAALRAFGASGRARSLRQLWEALDSATRGEDAILLLIDDADRLRDGGRLLSEAAGLFKGAAGDTGQGIGGAGRRILGTGHGAHGTGHRKGGRRPGILLSVTGARGRLPVPLSEIAVGPFGEHDIREFVSGALGKGPPRMGEECMRAMLSDSGGNPRVIATMCRVVYERLKDGEKVISKGHYLMFLPAVISALSREMFEPIYRNTPEAERRLLAAFARAGGPAHISDIARRMRKPLGPTATLALRLVSRGGLVRVGRGRYDVFTKLFGRYVLAMER